MGQNLDFQNIKLLLCSLNKNGTARRKVWQKFQPFFQQKMLFMLLLSFGFKVETLFQRVNKDAEERRTQGLCEPFSRSATEINR